MSPAADRQDGRPAAAAGRLTRDEREGLLVQVEKQPGSVQLQHSETP